MIDRTTYTNGKGKHSYEISVGADRHEGRFEVYASNRTQAAARVKRDGYVVRDVNMIG